MAVVGAAGVVAVEEVAGAAAAETAPGTRAAAVAADTEHGCGHDCQHEAALCALPWPQPGRPPRVDTCRSSVAAAGTEVMGLHMRLHGHSLPAKASSKHREARPWVQVQCSCSGSRLVCVSGTAMCFTWFHDQSRCSAACELSVSLPDYKALRASRLYPWQARRTPAERIIVTARPLRSVLGQSSRTQTPRRRNPPRCSVGLPLADRRRHRKARTAVSRRPQTAASASKASQGGVR